MDLDHIHSVQLDIMDIFHSICEKHGITYFLDSGTALGAIRHKGFIPWDDDVDVGMLRSDFDRFAEVADKELPADYFFQTKKTDREYPNFNAKIRKRDTCFLEEGTKDLNIVKGIFIDIFPFDYIPDDIKKARRILAFYRRFIRIIRFRQRNVKSYRGVKFILRGIVQIVPQSFFEEKLMKLCKKFNKCKTGTIVCFPYRMSQRRDLFFNISGMLPVKKTLFENREYNIMQNEDYYLKIMYGNYMELPPLHERTGHLMAENKHDGE